MFVAPNNERYLGSSINFNIRLTEDKDQFSNRRKPTILHLYKYEYSQYKWSPIYLTLNYYNLFIYKYPHYSFNKGKTDILIAIIQILPRILEQSLLNSFIFSLNGKDKLVRFLYTNWDPQYLNLPAVKDKMSKSVSIVIEGKEVKTVNSIQKLLPILGIKSRNTKFFLLIVLYVYYLIHIEV